MRSSSPTMRSSRIVARAADGALFTARPVVDSLSPAFTVASRVVVRVRFVVVVVVVVTSSFPPLSPAAGELTDSTRRRSFCDRSWRSVLSTMNTKVAIWESSEQSC